MRLHVLWGFIRPFRADAIAVSSNIVGCVPGPDWVGVSLGLQTRVNIRYVRPLICALVSHFLPEAFRLRMITLDHHKWVVSLLRLATFPLVALRFERGNAGDIGSMSGAQTWPTYAQFGQRCCHNYRRPHSPPIISSTSRTAMRVRCTSASSTVPVCMFN